MGAGLYSCATTGTFLLLSAIPSVGQLADTPCLLQVLLVGAPVVALLQDVSSDIKFICYALLMFTFPMSTMGLIILPKILIVRRMEMQANAPDATPNPAVTSLPVSEPDHDPSATNPQVEDVIEQELRESQARRSYHGPRMQVVTFD